MAAVFDNVKALVQEQIALLRVKLDQVPALQNIEVSTDIILEEKIYDWVVTSFVFAFREK